MTPLRGSLDSHAHAETWDLEDARPTLPKLLRRAIFDNELSTETIARWSGCDVARLHGAADGALELTVLELETVSTVLGLTLDEFIDERPPRFPGALGRDWEDLPFAEDGTAMRALGELLRDVTVIDGLEQKGGLSVRLPRWVIEARAFSPSERARLARVGAGLPDGPIASVAGLGGAIGARVVRSPDPIDRFLVLRAPVAIIGVPAGALKELASFRYALAVAISDLLFGRWQPRQSMRLAPQRDENNLIEEHIAFAEALLLPQALASPSEDEVIAAASTYGVPPAAITQRFTNRDPSTAPKLDETKLRETFVGDFASLRAPTVREALSTSVGVALSASRVTTRRARQLLGIPMTEALPFAFLGGAALPLVDSELLAVRAIHAHLAAKSLSYVATRAERVADGNIRVYVGDQRDGTTVECGYFEVDANARLIAEHLTPGP